MRIKQDHIKIDFDEKLSNGLTKREWFFGQVINGVLSRSGEDRIEGDPGGYIINSSIAAINFMAELEDNQERECCTFLVNRYQQPVDLDEVMDKIEETICHPK